jgi:hypothetical protein
MPTPSPGKVPMLLALGVVVGPCRECEDTGFCGVVLLFDGSLLGGNGGYLRLICCLEVVPLVTATIIWHSSVCFNRGLLLEPDDMFVDVLHH